MNVSNAIIGEHADDMGDSIHFSDIRQKFITQAFSLRRALDQSGNIKKFNRRINLPSGIRKHGQGIHSLIGSGTATHIWQDDNSECEHLWIVANRRTLSQLSITED